MPDDVSEVLCRCNPAPPALSREKEKLEQAVGAFYGSDEKKQRYKRSYNVPVMLSPPNGQGVRLIDVSTESPRDEA